MKARKSLVMLMTALIVTLGPNCKCFSAGEYQQPVAVDIEKIRITVIYDNNPGMMGLEADWGFSCIIWGLDRTILFDTGQQPSILMSNMAKLGINPKQVELIVLSHEHGDHIGGLCHVGDGLIGGGEVGLGPRPPPTPSSPCRCFLACGGDGGVNHGLLNRLGRSVGGRLIPQVRQAVLDVGEGVCGSLVVRCAPRYRSAR